MKVLAIIDRITNAKLIDIAIVWSISATCDDITVDIRAVKLQKPKAVAVSIVGKSYIEPMKQVQKLHVIPNLAIIIKHKIANVDSDHKSNNNSDPIPDRPNIEIKVRLIPKRL